MTCPRHTNFAAPGCDACEARERKRAAKRRAWRRRALRLAFDGKLQTAGGQAAKDHPWRAYGRMRAEWGTDLDPGRGRP